jgi:UDP-2,3-diacylglucosamine hydrolase
VRVLPCPCYVISDAHLGVTPPDVERAILAFLDQLDGQASSLIINGDLFDFWFEWRSVIPRAGFRVLAALARLAEHGTPLLWIAGNHDCWGGRILREDVGATFHVGTWRGTIGEWTARIDHGDGLRQVEDRRYRLLRGVLRHRWAVRAFRLIHPDLGIRIALGSSHASRTYRARDGGAGLREVAKRELAREPTTDLLIFGHSHVPTLEPITPGRVYANAGTWMDDTTYLRIDNQSIELRRWHGAEGRDEQLGSVSRGLVAPAPTTER